MGTGQWALGESLWLLQRPFKQRIRSTTSRHRRLWHRSAVFKNNCNVDVTQQIVRHIRALMCCWAWLYPCATHLWQAIWQLTPLHWQVEQCGGHAADATEKKTHLLEMLQVWFGFALESVEWKPSTQCDERGNNSICGWFTHDAMRHSAAAEDGLPARTEGWRECWSKSWEAKVKNKDKTKEKNKTNVST